MLRHDLIAYAGGLVAGAGVLVTFGFVDLLASTHTFNDLAGFWAGPRALLDGVDPYDTRQWQAAIARLGTQETRDLVYGYPPWMLVALLPLALLPIGPATLIWTVIGIGLAIVATWLLLRAVAPGWPLLHGLVGVTLLGSQPAILSFYSGQWTFLLLGALAFMTVLLLRGDERAGLFATVFVVKPHLFLFAAIGFARAAIARGATRSLGLAALVTVVPVGAVALTRPDWVATWARHIPAGRAIDAPRAATLPAALGDLIGPAGAWLGVALLLSAIALAWQFHPRGTAALAVWITVSLAAAIYGWSYDHLLLLVPIVIAAGVARRASRLRGTVMAAGGIALVLVGEIALYQLAPSRGSQSFNALVPALVTGLIVASLWPLRRGSGTSATEPRRGDTRSRRSEREPADGVADPVVPDVNASKERDREEDAGDQPRRA